MSKPTQTERYCATCGTRVLRGESSGDVSWYCTKCDIEVYDDPSRVPIPKLPHFDQGIQFKTWTEAEKHLAQRIKTTLQRAGFVVWLIGQGDAKRGGNDEAAPDIFYTRLEWEGAIYGMEVKLPGYAPSDVRPMQQHFVDKGVYPIVTTTVEAMSAARERLAQWKGEQNV
jgi:hypothetical protein